jgi:hypothetical protein
MLYYVSAKITFQFNKVLKSQIMTDVVQFPEFEEKKIQVKFLKNNTNPDNYMLKLA